MRMVCPALAARKAASVSGADGSPSGGVEAAGDEAVGVAGLAAGDEAAGVAGAATGAASSWPARSAASIPAPPGVATTAARIGASPGENATTRPSDRPPGIGAVPVLAIAPGRRRPSALAEP